MIPPMTYLAGGLRPGAGALLPVLGFAALVLLVHRFDAPLVLGGVLLLAGAVPLLLWPEIATLLTVFLLYTNIPFIASKGHGVPEAAAASFLLLLVLPLLHRLVVRGEQPTTDRILPMLLLYLGALLLAALGARSVDVALDYIVKFLVEGLLLYFLMINAVRSLPTLRRVIWTALAAGGLLGGLSLYQEVTGSFDQQFGGLAHRNSEYLQLRLELERNPDDEAVREAVRTHGTGDRSRRAEGPMDEPNRYAQIMIVLLPLAAFAYRTAGGRTTRLCAAAAGALILAGVVVSQSRGAFVAVGMLVMLGLFLKWIRPVHVVICALALVPVVPLVMPSLMERIGSITTAVDLVQDEPSGEADGAIRGRATAMMASFQAFLDHPVLGVGPGQYTPFYSVEYHQKNPRLKFRDLRVPRRAHSLYFEMAAELGLIGLGVFLSIVLVLLRQLWRARRRSAGRRVELADLATALCLSLLAYMATAVFLHLSFARYFWFLVALSGAALLVIQSREEVGRETPAPPAATRKTAGDPACQRSHPGETATCSP